MMFQTTVPPEYAQDGFTGVYCSECSKDIEPEDGFLHCKLCEWDLCVTCARMENQNEEKIPVESNKSLNLAL